MKIAIITMHAVKNYGSVLQTYATQRVFEQLGLDVEVINYIRKKNLNKNLLNTWTQNDTGVNKIAKKAILLPTILRWKKVFGGYIGKNISLSSECYTSEKELIDKPISADIFCTGSDQVWNSGWNNGIEKPFYLSFVPDSSPKISLAASIGKTKLEKEEIDAIYPLLKRYLYITMREISGLQIVRDMGLNNSGFCLDPTLLLSHEEWMEHAKPIHINERYALIYQLNHDTQFDEFAINFAKRKKLKLYRVCTRFDQIRLSGKAIVLPEVQELLSLINNAEYILTNSFHATAFCINFNKQFISVYPNEYSSRIDDVLKMFALENRRLTDYSQIDIGDNLIDYKDINEKLNACRKDSFITIEKMIKMSLYGMERP